MTNTPITRENATERLFEAVPQVKPVYDQRASQSERWFIDDDGRPMLHIVFGDTLSPYLERLLSDANLAKEHRSELEGIFAFLEEMATSPHEPVQNVLVVTVLEGLRSTQEMWDRAREFMGPRTNDLADPVERWSTLDQKHVMRRAEESGNLDWELEERERILHQVENARERDKTRRGGSD